MTKLEEDIMKSFFTVLSKNKYEQLKKGKWYKLSLQFRMPNEKYIDYKGTQITKDDWCKIEMSVKDKCKVTK